MAHMTQEKKALIAPAVKAILAKYKCKGSLRVRHHSTLVLTIKSGEIDFINNYINKVKGKAGYNDAYLDKLQDISINPYWYKEHFTGDAKNCLWELLLVMNQGNHDRSDVQSDYFDVGWYVDINIGRWDKPYILVK